MKEKAIEFIKYMIDEYGVTSCFDNIDEDNPIEEEGLWFECPICGEPILLFDDWELEEVVDCCPVCEERYED